MSIPAIWIETWSFAAPPGRSWLAFGLGVRGCWGKKLSQIKFRTVIALLILRLQFLEIPDALANNDATEGIARKPNRVFVRLRKVADILAF